jgi:DNA-binding CsgD family transcriptional regulator
VLIINIKKQKLDLQQLQQELNNAEQSLAHSDQRMQLARHEYSKLIQNQFETWQLSQSEQEIAFLLLKGLSFIEIAAIRQTKEKTVRQQASEIYRKSGVNGRHAFSAWFFEDFLN